MTEFNLTINGEKVSVDSADNTPLLYVLRNDLALKGSRFGCGTGHCGACTVIMNGNAVQSCDTPMWSSGNAQITTIEGLSDGEKLDPLQQAFIDEQAVQCGYCIPGIIMTVRALLDKNPATKEEEIIEQLTERNLCRCGTHVRILRAIRRVLNSVVDNESGDKGVGA